MYFDFTKVQIYKIVEVESQTNFLENHFQALHISLLRPVLGGWISPKNRSTFDFQIIQTESITSRISYTFTDFISALISLQPSTISKTTVTRQCFKWLIHNFYLSVTTYYLICDETDSISTSTLLPTHQTTGAIFSFTFSFKWKFTNTLVPILQNLDTYAACKMYNFVNSYFWLDFGVFCFVTTFIHNVMGWPNKNSLSFKSFRDMTLPDKSETMQNSFSRGFVELQLSHQCAQIWNCFECLFVLFHKVPVEVALQTYLDFNPQIQRDKIKKIFCHYYLAI